MPTFTRKRNPPDDKAHRWYEDCLRLDFEFRCAYCLIHEADNQGHENYEVDHFRPKSRFKDLERSYTNLYYACQLCNRQGRKGHVWPTPDEESRGERFVDPCAEDWEEHVEFQEDGSVRPLTPAGRYSADKLGLGRDQLGRHRRKFPGEYFNRSALRNVKQRLNGVLAAMDRRRDLSAELASGIHGLEQQLLTLERSVRDAWARKVPLPPEPRCPY